MNIEIKSQKFEVYYEDFEEKLTYREAKEYCEILGDGWRLPTLKEMLEMYDNKDELGLIDEAYWSSAEYDNNFFEWIQYFSNGYQDGTSKYYMNYVRAVRTI